MICKLLGESLVKGGVFHVDDHRACFSIAIISANLKPSSCGGNVPMDITKDLRVLKELGGLLTTYFFTGFDISSRTVLYKLSAFRSLNE